MCIKNKLLIVVSAFLVLHPVIYAEDISLNVQEMSHIDQSVIGGFDDVWGWYDAANAKYYALACNPHNNNGGLAIIDATDPEFPIVLGLSYHGTPRWAVDVKIVGDYAYVASQRTANFSEIWIYDLQYAVLHPNSPPQWWLKLDDEGTGDVLIDNCHTLFATEDYLFLAESNVGPEEEREVAILSLQNPQSPTFLRTWARADFDAAFGWPHAVYAQGTTAYVFDFGGGTYQVDFNPQTGAVEHWEKIWYNPERGDVKNEFPHVPPYFRCDPTNPKRPFSHSGWLTQDGQYIIVADEHATGTADCQPTWAPCLRIFNLDQFYEPQNPDTRVISLANAFDIIWNGAAGADQYVIGPEAIDFATEPYGDATPCPFGGCLGPPPNYFDMGMHQPLIKGRLAFLSWYARGLQVLDLSQINTTGNPIFHAGYFDHSTGTDGDWIQEAYGVYPFSPDGYIYVSGAQGLYIYRYGYTGTLAENTTWRGDVYVYDALTVPSNIALTIEPGTDIHMFGDAVINVNGFLDVNGTVSDSVRFFALGPNPQPGDWQEIHFLNGSGGTLQYCAIRHAVIGIEMEDFSDVEMDNCLIKSNRLRESTLAKMR